MTDSTLVEDSQLTYELPSFLKTAVLLAIMTLGLLGSISLLKWAINEKLSGIPVVESSQITSEIRDRQLGCLAKNIYHEAGGEPFEGKVAVAQVTLNRVNSGQFPGDVCRTIYQKNVVYEKVICQFSWTCDRVSKFVPTNSENYRESMTAAQRVLLENYRLPSLKNALYYHGDYINPGWRKKRVAHIGRHIFYE
jgi:spore germination cell wall hydrolase CwlJ-like protein